MAEEELVELNEQQASLQMEVLRAMIPPETTDSRNSVMEIRGGAGAMRPIFLRGLIPYVQSLCGAARLACGSDEYQCRGNRRLSEIIFNISGQDVYKFLKFESGVHRVQRVPVTETQGGSIPQQPRLRYYRGGGGGYCDQPTGFDISTMRASGAGGQHVNTTDSAVMMVHKPTGVTVYCADERSQIKNRAKALTVMRSRLLKAKVDEEIAKYAAERKGQIGTGDRSERIRTYNYPQGRLTDHRIGLSLSLPSIIDGQLADLIDALQNYDYEARIQNLLEKEMQ